MMPKIDSQFKNGSAINGDIVDRISETSITCLMKNGKVEDSTRGIEVKTGKSLSCASSVSEDSGFGSDIKDHVTDRCLNINSGFSSERKTLRIDAFIDSNVDKCNDNHDDNRTICGNDGRIVIQKHWTFVNEDEKVEKRCDGCVDESDNENKINCADLDDERKNMKEICSRDGGQVDKINKNGDVGNTSHSFQSVQSTCSESTRLDPSCKRTESYELIKYSAVDKHLNIALLESSYKNIHPGDMCNKYISTEKRLCKKTRETGDSVNSAVVSKASCEIRTVRRRRKHRLQDANNNNTGPRSVTSFIGRVPFTFHDCFQEQGLLSLVACIIYTLILMVILSIFCVIIEALKSAVGTDNLKKIRRSILRYRHTRMSMAAAGHS